MASKNAYKNCTNTHMEKRIKEDGFTLIEVLIALTIFAIGLLAVAAMQVSAVKVNSTAGKLTNLSTLGMDKVEELSALPYTDAELTAGNHTDPVTPDGYSVSWDVVVDNPVTSTKNVTVTITGRGKTAVVGFLKPNV
jgi:type IV pilus assembly protein PilV